MADVSTINVSDELGRKLERAASSRGLTADELAAEVLEEHVVVDDEVESSRPKLRLIGVGSSGEGITHRIDELLADGFGRR